MDFKISSINIQNKQGYGAIARVLHWGMAFLVVLAVCAIEVKGLLPKGPLRHTVSIWHFQAGLCVLFLLCIRIVWRLTHPAPPIVPPLSGLQQRLSGIGHLSLYALMLILPILGVLARQSKGNAVDFLGYMLPVLLDKGSGAASVLRNLHSTLGNVLIGLVAIHVALTFYHHRIRKDNTLLRMLR